LETCADSHVYAALTGFKKNPTDPEIFKAFVKPNYSDGCKWAEALSKNPGKNKPHRDPCLIKVKKNNKIKN
jgi:hypothetical protein